MKQVGCSVLLVVFALASAALGQDDVVTKAMRDELSRSMKDLHLPNLDKPYFISYRVDDTTTAKISATLGEITDENLYRGRNLAVSVRVGDFNLDNSNFLQLRSVNNFAGDCGCHSTLPLDDDYTQIRRQIWLATDAAYRSSASELAAKRSVLEHRQHGKDLPDFTPQAATTLIEKIPVIKTDVAALKLLARELSGQFRSSPEFLFSSVDIWAIDNYVRFIDSEGTASSRLEPVFVMDVRASLPASDGQPLRDWFRVYASSLEDLQKDALVARTRDLIARMKALSVAKTLDQYSGPVIFEGEASADVVGQVLAPALVALRPPLSDEPKFEAQFQQFLNQFGGTLSDRVGTRVLPQTFNVTDNPTISHFRDASLYGAERVDDEGTPSHEVKIIENGVLKNLLAGRTPTPQTKTSTGSVRGNGAAPSNLFVTTQNPKTSEELHKQLLSAAKERGYDYGIIIRNTGVGPLNSFMRLAASSQGVDLGGGTAVYKLFANGHEELVRADIEPISLAAFRDILAGGDATSVTNESVVPFGGRMFSRTSAGGSANNFTITSCVVPSLLFEEVSLKQPVGSAPQPPTLPSPLAAVR
jgi:predicted Zn-dependent protease